MHLQPMVRSRDIHLGESGQHCQQKTFFSPTRRLVSNLNFTKLSANHHTERQISTAAPNSHGVVDTSRNRHTSAAMTFVCLLQVELVMIELVMIDTPEHAKTTDRVARFQLRSEPRTFENGPPVTAVVSSGPVVDISLWSVIFLYCVTVKNVLLFGLSIQKSVRYNKLEKGTRTWVQFWRVQFPLSSFL